MNILNFAIPVIKSKAKFIVDKGHPWSTIEHLVLYALSKQSWSISALASHANLPRRVVMESIIRLMRAGWAELEQATSGTLFKTTIFGKIALDRIELPTILERKNRPTNFIVDLVCGHVYRNREWAVFTEQTIRDRAKNENFVILTPDSEETSIDVTGMLSILLDPDETFVSAEPKGVIRRYVVATLKDGVIHGLPPKRDLSDLKEKIIEISQSRLTNISDENTEVKVSGTRFEPLAGKENYRDIKFNLEDIILGGTNHLKALLDAIDNARTKIIIHSTFIEESKFSKLTPNLIEAAKRGVMVHIFWGQNEINEESSSSRRAITAIFNSEEIAEFTSSIIIHPHSTGSHSKFIISDSACNGEFIAIIGSCNWFTSNFSTYEASVLLRDPRIVKDVISYASRLCCIHDGIWTDLATEIALIGQKLISQTAPSNTNATASLIIGEQHNSYIYRARDEAKERIFVTSHRLGGTLYSSVLPALKKAVEEKNIMANILFNQETDPVTKKDVLSVKNNASLAGIQLETVEAPKLHAKILAWDNNDILITSLNWLSADPKGSDNLKELGIHINLRGAAETIISDLQGRIICQQAAI